MAGIARKLNLAAHNVKGSKDLNPKTIHAGVDVRAYKLEEDRFGLVNLWNCLRRAKILWVVSIYQWHREAIRSSGACSDRVREAVQRTVIS